MQQLSAGCVNAILKWCTDPQTDQFIDGGRTASSLYLIWRAHAPAGSLVLSWRNVTLVWGMTLVNEHLCRTHTMIFKRKEKKTTAEVQNDAETHENVMATRPTTRHGHRYAISPDSHRAFL